MNGERIRSFITADVLNTLNTSAQDYTAQGGTGELKKDIIFKVFLTLLNIPFIVLTFLSFYFLAKEVINVIKLFIIGG